MTSDTEINRLLERLRDHQEEDHPAIVVVRNDAAAMIERLRAEHEARCTELLTHTTELELQRRAEKTRADDTERALLSLAKVAGDIATIRLRDCGGAV